MPKVIVIVAHGFSKANARLQPWRYVLEIARQRAKVARVIVITDGSAHASERWDCGIEVVETSFLSVGKQKQLRELIVSCDPNELWWSTTTRSIAFYPLLSSLDCYKIAFITSPLYRWAELLKATIAGVPFDQTKVLWLQRLVPRIFFRWLLNARVFSSIVTQSENNKNILLDMGVKPDKLYRIPVGIDPEDIAAVDMPALENIRITINRQPDEVIYLYMGALRPIRGFDALLKAFKKLSGFNKNVRLIVLARGAGQAQCEKLQQQFINEGLGGRLDIVGGWLSREDIWAYLSLVDVVALPFVLVPSDIPIAVLEALARGRPVITSHVDGLPEMVRGRGIVVDPLNTTLFAEQMDLLAKDHTLRTRYGDEAAKYMRNYPRWDDIGALVQEMLESHHA